MKKKIAWLIWGFGQEGQAAYAWLNKHYPKDEIVIHDERELNDEITQIEHWPADWSMVGNLCLSPGVSLYRPEVQQAIDTGVQLSSVSQLWFDHERENCTVIAVSGSKGKSTTASLIETFLKTSGYRVAIAGNVGEPLLAVKAQDYDYVVIELSSYQLASLDARMDCVVITSLYPEHLDWHGSEEQYYQDKLRLMSMSDKQIFHSKDAEQILEYQCDAKMLETQWNQNSQGIMLDGEMVLAAKTIPLQGAHNQDNVLLALRACEAVGVLIKQPQKSLKNFAALPHRLEKVGLFAGLEWINDSISTIPQSSLAAVNAFAGRSICLILGGHDRGVCWSRVAVELAGINHLNIIVLPENGERIAQALLKAGFQGRLDYAHELSHAVKLAVKHTPKGGTVLLSPGAPSYGQYQNFKQRGEAFVKAIKQL